MELHQLARGAVLQDGTGNEIGTAANPMVVSAAGTFNITGSSESSVTFDNDVSIDGTTYLQVLSPYDVNLVTVTDDGKFGVGVAAPAAEVELVGYGDASFMGANVGVGTTITRALLDVDGAVYIEGNVGLGTITPRAALDVDGTVYFGKAVKINAYSVSAGVGLSKTLRISQDGTIYGF